MAKRTSKKKTAALDGKKKKVLVFVKKEAAAKKSKAEKKINEKNPAPKKPRIKRSVRLHKSFRRSYREDYTRELETPGIMVHIVETFQAIFRNFRILGPLILLAAILNVAFIGLMSESTYESFSDTLNQTTEELGTGDIGAIPRAGLLLISTVTSGGLDGESNEASIFFAVEIFLLMWLATIFVVRHDRAKKRVSFRDTIYNSAAPLMSTIVVFLVALIDCIPIFLFIVALSAAVETEFLATPFYALVFFIFAAVMILTSVYLLARDIVALIAVSAPGLYPGPALKASADLIAGRRTRLVVRMVAVVILLAVMWVIIMLPVILIDMALTNNFEWAQNVPLVPICLLMMTCFSAVYVSAYFYIYYRYLLDFDEKSLIAK